MLLTCAPGATSLNTGEFALINSGIDKGSQLPLTTGFDVSKILHVVLVLSAV